MDCPRTPVMKKLSNVVNIPPSPFMKSLGFGTGVCVYKLDRSPANDKTQSPWAIKKVTKVQRNTRIVTERLHVEAELLRKLNHPNVVGFRAFTADIKGKPCLAMEACSCSLGDLIEKRYDMGELAFESNNILKVGNDTAKAMNYLHNEAKIIHCDIKSYNILVKGKFEICKLCDFGIALPLNDNLEVEEKYIKGNDQLGTLAWMAPETLKSNILTAKCDVYSFGLVIWEMLALVPPPPQDGDSSMITSDLSDFSALDDSQDSCRSDFDLSLCNPNCREFASRPELPSQEFSVDYNFILELFYCCTNKDPMLRPKSDDLVLITEKMLDDLMNTD